jgi:hypothetical protein
MLTFENTALADGKTNWMEGLILFMVYVLIAVAFWVCRSFNLSVPYGSLTRIDTLSTTLDQTLPTLLVNKVALKWTDALTYIPLACLSLAICTVFDLSHNSVIDGCIYAKADLITTDTILTTTVAIVLVDLMTMVSQLSAYPPRQVVACFLVLRCSHAQRNILENLDYLHPRRIRTVHSGIHYCEQCRKGITVRGQPIVRDWNQAL